MSEQQPEAKKTYKDKIKEVDVPILMKLLRVVNTINGLLLIVAGVAAFVNMSGTNAAGESNSVEMSVVFSALYIIMFSTMLVVFEVQCCSRLDMYLFTYFGFMYSICGRFAFFLFIGTLAFALRGSSGDSWLGPIMGGITIAVVMFNLWVVHTNKDYLENLRSKNIAMRLEAQNHVIAKNQGVEMNDKGGQSAMASNKAPKGDDWERMYDDEADSYYYYNNKTKETRWDQSNI